MTIANRIMQIVDAWTMRGFPVDAIYLGSRELAQLDLEEHFIVNGPLGTRWKWNGMEIYRVDATNHLSIAPRLP